MKTERRRGVTFRIVLLVLGFVLFRVTIVSVAGTPDQIRSIHQFDFGTETSPVEKSTVRITGTDSYDKNVGYGWLSDGQQAFDRNEPIKELKHSGNRHRPDFLYNAHATDITRDGVSSEQAMVFRVDLPTGKYRVNVWVGDLHTPLESMALDCNGLTVASGISAKHIIGRNAPESTGLYQRISFTTNATEGKIELRFFGDETKYLADKAQYDQWFPQDKRPESYRRSSWNPERHLKFDPKSAFSRNSVLAVQITPYQDRLIRWQDGGLVVVTPTSRLQRMFVETVNAKRLKLAEQHLQNKFASVDLRVEGYLTLLGHPEIRRSDEKRLLPRTRQAIEEALRQDPNHIWAREGASSLDIFTRARNRFINRGRGEEGHFQENRKVVSMMRLIRPVDLLYYKALQYQGRALQMLDPHRWVYCSGDAQAAWKTLSEDFPNDRFARFYLTNQWTADQDWHFNNHLQGTEDAPKWAVAQKEAYGLLLDLCEWWAANKQQADGSVGGGWGDDVEIVSFFGIMGFISQGASSKAVDMAIKLIDGMWTYSGVDQEAGFFRGLADAEHSAEWTGDTLPLMLTLDYGNPIWIERATKTAELMRNLWMDQNQSGDYHFRSNFLGAMSVGEGQRANDSFINWRAALPAKAVYRYNHNPLIGQLFTRWADAWFNDAMRTDRGKPKGVFPADVGFPGGELGGIGSPNWFTGTHPRGTVNHDWIRGSYKAYLINLMTLAYEITGDEKYFQPFHIQRELADQYRSNPVPTPEPGSQAWVGKVLSEGSRRGHPAADQVWEILQKKMAVKTGLPAILTDQRDVLKRMNTVRQRVKLWWPTMTTEASATDRVIFPGIVAPYLLMCGASGLNDFSVSYAGVNRNFAAFVKYSDDRQLKVIIYNFASQDADQKADTVGLIPWRLEINGQYHIRAGVDNDVDDEIDSVAMDETLVLYQLGQQVQIPFAAKQTTIVEIRQVERGRGKKPLSDLAVVADEIWYSIWNRELEVTIHNVGTATARQITVGFYEEAGLHGSTSSAKRIAQVTVPHLSWPMDLEAKSITLSARYVPKRSDVFISVVVDEGNQIQEIYERNNTARRRFDFNMAEINAPRKGTGEIGGDVSGEIRRSRR